MQLILNQPYTHHNVVSIPNKDSLDIHDRDNQFAVIL